MNKIYKVIWNKNKNSYDVAPETAKNQGKQKSIMVNTGKFLAKSFIVALAVSIIGIPIDESKATIAINSNGRISVYKTNSAGEYVDKYGYATTNPDEYVLIGRQENNAVTVSGNIRGTSLATATGHRSIAIGESSKSSTNDSLAIGTWAEAGTDGDGAILPSATGAVAIGYNSTASAIDAISLGSSSKAGGQNSISLGSRSSANGVGSISLGSNANIQGSTFNGAKANDSFSIALGTNSAATGASSISIGYAATSNSQSTTQSSGYTQGATSIGSASSAIGRQSVALGAAAQAKAEQSTAIGNDTVASGFGSISIGGDDTGYSADKDKSKINDPYIYTQTTAVGYFKKNSSNQFNYAYRPSVATGVGAVTIGVHSQSLSDGSTAIGVSATAGDDADGVRDTDTSTEAKEATAVGAFARAKSLNSTAVGHNATAQNIKSTSIGNDATATGIQAVAIGNATVASGTSSAAIGDNAIASNENAISIGTNAQATAKNSISIGTGNKVTGAGSGAIGDPTTISGADSYSLGNNNTIPDDNSTIVGNNNVLSQGDSGNSTSDNSHIMGNNVKVRGEGAIAIGNGVVTGDANYETGSGATENVIAIGNSSVGNGVSTLAIGTSAKAYGEKSIAIGDSALSAKDSGMKENIAIGSGAKVNKGSNSIVLGTGSYSDATNGSSIAIGFGANVTSATVSDGIAIGLNASVANTNGGVAIGKKAITTNSNGGEGSPIAIGDSSEATGTQSIAIGYNTKAWNNQIGETVIGSNANATANYGTIIGYGAKGLGNQTDQTVIGHNATASNTSQYATVIGSGATATREYSTVIGTNASSTTDGGVAIGSNSVSDRQNGGNGVTDVTRNPYIPSTATEAQKSAIQSTIGTTGAVSVGSDIVKRQIINVAAGSADSDAVNVAQLKAAVSTVSSDTTAAKTTVTSKNNTVSITPSIEQDGHTNYDLSVKTDGATITTTDGTLHAVTTGFTTNDAGNILATTGTSLVTGADVATAINSAGFTLTTGGTTSTAGVTALVTPGSTVTIAGGKNISVAQTNNVITVNTADNVVTTDTDKYVTEGTATYNPDGSGTATLTGTNGLTATVTGLKNTTVASGTVSYDRTGAGTGTITNNDGTTASITGLANNYVVSAIPSTDGKTVTLTRNDGSKVAIDLTNTITNATDTAATNAANKDFKLVKNPNNKTDGSYSVEADGSVTLTVANNAGETQTVTIKDIASKADGLTFTGNSGSTGLKALGSSIAVTGTNGITTTATAEGITISGSGLADTNLSNITNEGNTVISNIANKSVAITKGTNVSSVASQTVKNEDGTSTTTYTINADGTTVSGSDAVTVTPGVKNTNNVTDFAVDLSDATKQTLNQVTTNTNNIAGNTIKINNLTDTVNKGWNAHVNGDLAKNVKPDDNTLNFVNGDNIVVSHENGNIKIATANNVVTTDTDTYVTEGTATYNPDGNGTATLTGTNGLTATVTGLKNTTVASGTVSYDTTGAGTGTITNNDGTTASITGLANNYVVSATPSTDGKTVTLTRNDGSKVAIDLTNTITNATDTAATNAANKDFKLVKNPNNKTDGSYSVEADGSVTLTVANNAGETQTVTIKDIASKADGLIFTGNSGSTGLKALGSSIAVTGTNGITTTATAEGITISGSGLADTNLSNITNAGNTVISNIANKSVAITKGTNVSSVENKTVNNADGTSTTTYTINADGTTVSGSDAVTVTPGVKNTNNVTDFAVDLSDATKQTLNQVTTNTNNIAGNTIRINNLTDTVNKGWNAHVNGDLAKNVKPDDNTLNFVNGDNIVVSHENGNIKIATANNVVTTDTDKYVTEGTATYNSDGSGTATLTGTNGLTATVTGLKNTTVASGTVSYDTTGAGTGTITNNDGTTASITGLANNYVVSATPSTDGKTVTLTRNDGSKVAIDLTNTITNATDTAATNAANKDFKLVKNPNNKTDGSYSVEADGSVTLTVANNAGETQTVTIKDIASKADGLTFTGNSGSTGLKALGSSIAVTGTNGITTTATAEGITISGSGLADTNLSNITNAGNTVISNIANKSVAITKGTNVSSVASQTVKNEDGTSTTTYTINADGTTVSGSDAVTVTPGVKNTSNLTDYKVDLSQSSKDSLTKADTAIQEIKTQIDGTDVKTVTKTDNTVNFITGDNIELTPEHGGIKVALAKDLTGLNSVMSKTITGGTVVIGSGSNTTTLTSNADGLDVGGDKITNVAPGVAGTDAVNVNQLNTAVATAKTEVKAGDNVNVVKTAGSAGNDIYTVSADLSGLGTMSSFTATSNGSTDATKSGSIQDTDVVNFVNGINTTADTTVKADGSGIDVTYNLNKDLTGITSISNGGTKITVGDTTSPTSNTVNFGGATITNVTPGINLGDVATVGQLSKVAAGTNVVNVTTTEDSATKATIYTVNAKGTTASAGSTAVTVKAGIADTNNVTDYKVDLSQASKDSLMKADTAIQEIKTQIDGTDVKTLTKDNNSANFVSGHNIELTSDNGAIKIATTANASYTTVTAGNTTNNTTISGDSIMFKNGDTTNAITIKEGDKNVNGDIINRLTYTTTNPDGSTHTQQGATLEDGLLFGGDDNATNTVTRKLNQQLNILGGATDVTKNNIGVKYNDENSLIVQLAKNINLGNDGSVTTGNTVVNNGGVTVKDGNSTITLSSTGLATTDGNKTVSVTSGGLNNGGNTITNVASGNVTNTDADNTNVANISDVKAAVQKAGDTIVKTGTKYQGDNTAVTVTRELGETLNVVGGATGALSDNNIGVTGDANGSLKLQLAKDITGLTSVTTTDAAGNTNVMNGAGNTITNAAGDKTEVTAGNIRTTDAAGNKTTINGDTITTTNASGNTTIVNGAGVTIKNGVNDVTLTKDGLNNGNNQITNVASGGDTNTNAANIGDVKRIAGDTVTNELAKKTFGLTADDGNSATNTFDKTVGVKGDGQNISTSVNGTDVIVTMGKDLAVNTITAGKAGANGTDGTVVVNGKDGSSVVLNGKNGSIGLAGSDGKTTTISTGTDAVGVNGDNGTSRIIYTDKDGSSQKVATMNDGIKYAGDIGTVSTKLNKTTKIVGESAGKALTDSNIGVVATQDGDNAKLVVKLAKELTGLDSVSANTFTAGDTTVSTDGITINNGPSVTKTGIDAGGKTITNVAAGVNGNDAVNVNQLNEAVKNSKGSWKIDNNGSNVKEINSDANSVDFVNGNNTIVSVTGTSTGAKVKVDLANKVTIGDTTNGAPVTINGNTGTVSGLTNKTINYEGFADGSGRSATEEQVVEAANVIQQNVNRQIDGVRGAVADVGANAAAMAALKPMQYDPMEPTQVMIGAGGYKGSHAVAMGVVHYKNESTMFHAGVSVGAHDNMYNVGVTWKFGSRDEETAIPDRYKAGPISSVYVMQDEMSAVKAQNALLLSENKVQKDKLAEQDSKLATQEDHIEKLQMQIDALMAKLGM